jgi:hypothetical protein
MGRLARENSRGHGSAYYPSSNGAGPRRRVLHLFEFSVFGVTLFSFAFLFPLSFTLSFAFALTVEVSLGLPVLV